MQFTLLVLRTSHSKQGGFFFLLFSSVQRPSLDFADIISLTAFFFFFFSLSKKTGPSLLMFGFFPPSCTDKMPGSSPSGVVQQFSLGTIWMYEESHYHLMAQLVSAEYTPVAIIPYTKWKQWCLFLPAGPLPGNSVFFLHDVQHESRTQTESWLICVAVLVLRTPSLSFNTQQILLKQVEFYCRGTSISKMIKERRRLLESHGKMTSLSLEFSNLSVSCRSQRLSDSCRSLGHRSFSTRIRYGVRE